MLKLLKSLLLFLLLISFLGCEKHQERRLRLAVSPWIGYSPLYYAQETGMLKDAGIKLIHSTSLHETIHYYQADLIDAFVSTQYEAFILNDKTLVHYLAIDRSNGGDVILSNRSLETILKSKNIKTYLEIDSVNKLVFDEFLKKHNLRASDFDIYNKSQILIKDMKSDMKDDILIVTYEPYATLLRNSGFIELGSSMDKNILVLDSMYVNSHFVKEHNEKLQKLKLIIKQSYLKFEEDPKAYYDLVKSYLENPSFDEFMKSSSTIKWLLNEPRSELNKIFETHNILPLGDE